MSDETEAVVAIAQPFYSQQKRTTEYELSSRMANISRKQRSSGLFHGLHIRMIIFKGLSAKTPTRTFQGQAHV